jgi:hypothetical protein
VNERMVVVPVHLGTPGANYTWIWTLPVGMTLIHVSAVQSNAGSGTLQIGDSGDGDQAIAAFTMGVSGTPVEKATADFTDPHFVDGDVFTAVVDHDGDGGTAGQGIDIVFTFLVG